MHGRRGGRAANFAARRVVKKGSRLLVATRASTKNLENSPVFGWFSSCVTVLFVTVSHVTVVCVTVVCVTVVCDDRHLSN